MQIIHTNGSTFEGEIVDILYLHKIDIQALLMEKFKGLQNFKVISTIVNRCIVD